MLQREFGFSPYQTGGCPVYRKKSKNILQALQVLNAVLDVLYQSILRGSFGCTLWLNSWQLILVSTFVFSRWSESSILQRRKIKIQSEKVWHVASDVWDAWCIGALLVAFCGLNYIFGAVQFSPLLGRVREKWQCQSGLRENGIGSTHSMQPKSTQKCEGKTQFRFNHQCIGEKAVIDMLQN